MSAVKYEGDHGFDEFLANGGASSDLQVVTFLSKKLLLGAGDILLVKNPFGCSTISVKNENGGFLFGRNFDWNNCKYSFLYIENSMFENCVFDTKDAFWHAKNVTVKNRAVKGEYLAWYCENVTFENCKIIGTQPLCYCKGLKLINCEMIDTDLSFEKSEVEACVTTPIVSVKNPLSGHICAPNIGEIIRNDENSRGKITICCDGRCA